jgi:hypothetical protein
MKSGRVVSLKSQNVMLMQAGFVVTRNKKPRAMPGL